MDTLLVHLNYYLKMIPYRVKAFKRQIVWLFPGWLSDMTRAGGATTAAPAIAVVIFSDQ